MTSVDFSERELALIKGVADMQNVTVPEFIRRAVLERIEDEYDLADYERAMEEFRADPKTYTLDEVEKELGLALVQRRV